MLRLLSFHSADIALGIKDAARHLLIHKFSYFVKIYLSISNVLKENTMMNDASLRVIM